MSGLNARLEGFAKEQLSQGKGMEWIVRDLVRMGHIEREAAQAIVEKAIPEVRARSPRPGRRSFWFGLLLLAIPATVFGGYLYDALILSYGGRFNLGLQNALNTLLYLPMLLWEIVGFAFVAYGWSEMRRSKKSNELSGPHGPLATGLWWRADPFEPPGP